MMSTGALEHMRTEQAVLAGLSSPQLQYLLGSEYGAIRTALQACVFDGQSLELRTCKNLDMLLAGEHLCNHWAGQSLERMGKVQVWHSTWHENDDGACSMP